MSNMQLTVDITISDDVEATDEEAPEPALLQRWAAAAYLKQPDERSSLKIDIDDKTDNEIGSEIDSETASEIIVSILLSSPHEIQRLNRQYREKDKATNVLSFPMQMPDDVGVQLLGDIALCAAVINEEAKQQFKNNHAHWAHMVIHGMLHLQGFDHVDNKEADEMETLETDILAKLGFDAPYEQTLRTK